MGQRGSPFGIRALQAVRQRLLSGWRTTPFPGDAQPGAALSENPLLRSSGPETAVQTSAVGQASSSVAIRPSPIRRLVYRSIACCEASETERIFCDSQTSNAQAGVTGILFVSGPRFYQCIEGDALEVGRLFSRIQGDSRHCMVEVLDDQSVADRLFSYWAMGSLCGYETVLQTVVPLLDSCEADEIRVGLEVLMLCMNHQDARTADSSPSSLQAHRRGNSSVTDSIRALLDDSGNWVSVLAENVYLRAQLSRAEAGRTEFFSAISHELRTPMTGMLSASHLLCHPKAGADVMMRQRDMLMASSDRFCQTLEDIFALHRIETGDLALYPQAVDLHTQIRQVCSEFSQAMPADERNLSLSVTNEDLSQCEVDTSCLRVVLNSLLQHGLERTHNGCLNVSVRLLSLWDDKVWWRCSIRDVGSHVPVDRLSLMFQPFTAGMFHGTGFSDEAGLKLALAGSMVRLLNGRVGAANEPDGGLSVWFTFMVRRPVGVNAATAFGV